MYLYVFKSRVLASSPYSSRDSCSWIYAFASAQVVSLASVLMATWPLPTVWFIKFHIALQSASTCSSSCCRRQYQGAEFCLFSGDKYRQRCGFRCCWVLCSFSISCSLAFSLSSSTIESLRASFSASAAYMCWLSAPDVAAIGFLRSSGACGSWWSTETWLVAAVEVRGTPRDL